MYEYTDKNFIRFGYNKTPFVTRSSEDDNFFVHYGSIRREIKSFKEEMLITAKLIKEKSGGKPLWVLCSGGMDSEVVLRSFIESHIIVNVAIARFENDLNEHDIRYAIDFCKSNNIHFELFDINVESFWEKELEDYAVPISCISPQFPIVLWLMDQVDGIPIIGSGDSFLARYVNSNTFYFYEREKFFSYYFHLMRRKRFGVPAFLQYTPELLLSFLFDPELKKFIQIAKTKKILSISKWKYQVYKQHFNLKNRPIFTGFEQLEYLNSYYYERLKVKCQGGNENIIISYRQFINILGGG